jgi:hypothetical protein
MQLDRQRGEATLVELADQCHQGLRRVPQRVPGREQQLVRLDPRQDVRDFHDVEPLDQAVEARRAGDHLRAGERRCAKHLLHGQTRTGRTAGGLS